MAGTELAGRRVLIVEDDWFIADYVADALGDAGATLLGPVASAADGLALLDKGPPPDAATLNFSLADGSSLPVARRLDEMGVPFLFLSASASTALPPELKDRPRLDKPFAGFQVVQVIEGMVGN